MKNTFSDFSEKVVGAVNKLPEKNPGELRFIEFTMSNGTKIILEEWKEDEKSGLSMQKDNGQKINIDGCKSLEHLRGISIEFLKEQFNEENPTAVPGADQIYIDCMFYETNTDEKESQFPAKKLEIESSIPKKDLSPKQMMWRKLYEDLKISSKDCSVEDFEKYLKITDETKVKAPRKAKFYIDLPNMKAEEKVEYCLTEMDKNTTRIQIVIQNSSDNKLKVPVLSNISLKEILKP